MMWTLFAREMRLAWRNGAEILNPLWFFLVVITLFPFGVGATRSCWYRSRPALSGLPRCWRRCW